MTHINVHSVHIQLEYLVVYGRASSIDPSNVREARQLSTHGEKLDSESLYEPI